MINFTIKYLFSIFSHDKFVPHHPILSLGIPSIPQLWRNTWCQGERGDSRTGGCGGGGGWVTCCLLFSQGMLTRRRWLLQVYEYFRRHAAVLNAALAFVHALSQKGFFSPP